MYCTKYYRFETLTRVQASYFTIVHVRTYVHVRVQELKESRAHAHQPDTRPILLQQFRQMRKKARQVGPSQCNFQPHETYYASQIRERFVFYIAIYSFAFVKNLVRAGDHWKCENIRLSESTKYPTAGTDLGNCELTFECFFTSSMNPVDFCTVIGERRPVFLPFFFFFFVLFSYSRGPGSFFMIFSWT